MPMRLSNNKIVLNIPKSCLPPELIKLKELITATNTVRIITLIIKVFLISSSCCKLIVFSLPSFVFLIFTKVLILLSFESICAELLNFINIKQHCVHHSKNYSFWLYLPFIISNNSHFIRKCLWRHEMMLCPDSLPAGNYSAALQQFF